MVVGDGKQFCLPSGNPPFPVGSLTLGAMTIATAVVADLLMTTASALGFMTTQLSGSTIFYGLQCPLYLHTGIMLLIIALVMDIYYFSYFVLWTQVA